MKKSEREAAELAQKILRLAGRDGVAYDDYGAGKLTKAQKKSQERHIAMTERDNSRAGKVKRALWG